MVASVRVTLKDLPSGKIELVLVNGVVPVLEFNCSCQDALPYCQALCCRTRSVTNAVLTNEEAVRLGSRTTTTGLHVLQAKSDDTCIYLDTENRCKVQEEKPQACATWHCSPNGMGEHLTQKDKGWFLSPMGALLRPAV